MKKYLTLFILVLIPAVAFAAWKYNSWTGKLDFYQSADEAESSLVGGSNTQIQYNSSGSFAGSPSFTINAGTVSIAGNLSVTGTVSATSGSLGITTAPTLTIGGTATVANLYTSGNVGIGTTGPLGKLSIGTPAGVGAIKTWNTGVDQTSFDFYYTPVGDNFRRYLDIVANGDATIGTQGGSVIRFLTNPHTSDTASERVRIDDNGNVGIGTTAPGAKLDVKNATASTENIRISQGSISNGIAWYSTITGAPVQEKNWALLANHIAYGDFTLKQSTAQFGNPITAGLDRLYIGPTGLVGIGTTNPVVKLQVAGATPFLNLGENGTGGGKIEFPYGSDASSRSWFIDTDSIVFGDFLILTEDAKDGNLLTRMYINNTGNVGIGTTSPLFGGAVSASKLSLSTTDGFTAFVIGNATTPRLAINPRDNGGFTMFDWGTGSAVAGITQKGGYVGIGTTTPVTKLAVSGSVSISGNLGIGTTKPAQALTLIGTFRMALAGTPTICRDLTLTETGGSFAISGTFSCN